MLPFYLFSDLSTEESVCESNLLPAVGTGYVLGGQEKVDLNLPCVPSIKRDRRMIPPQQHHDQHLRVCREILVDSIGLK